MKINAKIRIRKEFRFTLIQATRFIIIEAVSALSLLALPGEQICSWIRTCSKTQTPLFSFSLSPLHSREHSLKRSFLINKREKRYEKGCVRKWSKRICQEQLKMNY